MAVAYIALVVAQGGIFVFCMYRSLSVGRAFERELAEKYPAVAQKRRGHPFYPLTFPGMLLVWQLAEEPEFHDESLHRKRQAVYTYFVAACLVITIPSLVAVLVSHGLG